MQHTPEFERALQIVERTGTNLFLTGKAGTGKTTFLRYLVTHSSKRLVVLAPTGIAAINAGGSTIHSFFQINPGEPFIPDEQYQSAQNDKYKISARKLKVIKSLDLIVIDEISMVRADLLDAMDAVLRRFRNRNKPFGGVQLLMIGDLQQLSPVVADGEWNLLGRYYATPFFFGSLALQKTNYITIELKTVFRQSDTKFLDLLNKVRENRADASTLEMLNKRYIPGFIPPKGEGYIRLVTHNRQANEINQAELDALKENTYTYECDVVGNFPESSFPVERTLKLKVGAQVMFVKNDQNHRYFNGMIGVITQIDSEGFVVKPDNQTLLAEDAVPEEDIEVGREIWENNRYTINEETKMIETQVEGTFSQFPVKLAWAITIHKSQGLTFEKAVIDAHSAFAHGQTYVALSRCKTFEGMVLSSPIPQEAIINDTAVKQYTERQTSRHISSMDIETMQKEYKMNLLDDLFDFSKMEYALNYFLRVLTEHFYKKYSSETDELVLLRNVFEEKVKKVSFMFGNQYRKMIESAEEEQLQERLHKAGAYFSEQLLPLAVYLSKYVFETDNKALKKQFSHALDELREALRMKMQLLKYLSENTFDVSDYVSVRGKVAVGESIEVVKKAKKIKKTKAEKSPKISTVEQTYLLWKDGKTIDEIARLRDLKQNTIYTHLVQLVVSGKISIHKVMSRERIEQISEFLRQRNFAESIPYAELKSELGEDFTYGELRMVRGILLNEEE